MIFSSIFCLCSLVDFQVPGDADPPLSMKWIFTTALVACQPQAEQAPPADDPPLSMKGAHMVQILLDPMSSDELRSKAARNLNALKEDEAVLDHLFQNFPEDEASMTKIIVALRDFESPKVLTRLIFLERQYRKVGSNACKQFLAREAMNRMLADMRRDPKAFDDELLQRAETLRRLEADAPQRYPPGYEIIDRDGPIPDRGGAIIDKTKK
jgi:hypothetical protein